MGGWWGLSQSSSPPLCRQSPCGMEEAGKPQCMRFIFLKISLKAGVVPSLRWPQQHCMLVARPLSTPL